MNTYKNDDRWSEHTGRESGTTENTATADEIGYYTGRFGGKSYKLNYGDKAAMLLHFSIIMMMSSNGNISALLAPFVGNSPVIGEFSTQRPVTRCWMDVV